MKNDERNLSSAIASAFGENPVIKLRLERRESEDSSFSPQMKELKAIFGGNLIRTNAAEEKEEGEVESYAIKHEPVRTDEDNGLYTEPDEDN